MKLSTRLVLLILGCLIPVLTAQVYSQVNLLAQRRDQLSTQVLRHAERANSELAHTIEGVRQLGVALGQMPDITTRSVNCVKELRALLDSLPNYVSLSVYSPSDRTLLCSAGEPAAAAIAKRPHQELADLLATQDTKVGAVVTGEGDTDPVLPVAVRIAGGTASGEPRVLIAGLSGRRLSAHLGPKRADHGDAMSLASIYIADRDGVLVARSAALGSGGTPRIPEWLQPLASRDTQGVELVNDPDGQAIIVGYVPAQASPVGVTVAATVPLPELTADIDDATYMDLMIIGAAAVMALVLAWVAGRRFIFRPSEALLQAARKWREGDLSARATLTDAGSEFDALSQSFNAMAAGLQAREMERRLQASFLEAQVAERTRELSESNNRLQVEIAGREKTEAALHQAQKLQAVGQLAGGIAHDFNNMLATVLGNLELMERRVSQAVSGWTASDTERLLKLIERATGAVQRGGQLTSRLLAFSRRQRLAARPTDINALLGELITLASSTLGRRVQVTPELGDAVWMAMVDPSQVEAAILNLCLNARDAMPDGGRLTITTSNLKIDTAAGPVVGDRDLVPGDYVRICISDTGVGMTPEVKARAFDPFFTTKGPGAGSGLGLSQVYGMARQSGGNVTIDSAPGEGTTVTLTLPRAVEAEEAAPTLAVPFNSRPVKLPSDLILVVDDDHAVRQVTVEMARDLGCEVAQASGGEQALALIGKLVPPPKLILLDYAMPGMNGLQLSKELRALGVTAPIALVTGYAELSEIDINTGQLAGLLRKPFTIRELQELIAQLRAVANGECGRGDLVHGLMDG